MKKDKPFFIQPERILVISMRYLGDVLLTTPLLHTLRRTYPDSKLDILVFDSTAAILEGNPDVDRVIPISQRPPLSESFKLIYLLFRNYDLAIVTQTGDRPFYYSLVASGTRIATVPPKKTTGWWKRFFMRYWIEFDDKETHTVLQNLKLCEFIGASPRFSLVPPRPHEKIHSLAFSPEVKNYAVLHILPQWQYKRWTEQGWIAVCRYLDNQGIRVVLSGSPVQAEIDYIASIQKSLPSSVINIAGKASLAQLSNIISRASLFIGPDTGITHLAAATGIPVIALYGPTNPVKWAPWPADYRQNKNPFQRKGSQQVNNVFLIQGEAECVPCHQEGCDNHRLSHSECLDTLSPERVIKTIHKILKQ